MYHVPIIRNTGVWSTSPCYDPISSVAAVFGLSESNKERKMAKSASEAAASRQAAAEQSLQQAQETASAQASARVDEKRKRARSGGSTIFTSPLGAAGTATTARKKLLGE
jgi:uncharacterized protein (DUF2147 family)